MIFWENLATEERIVINMAKAWSRQLFGELKERGYSKKSVLAGKVCYLTPDKLRLLRAVEALRKAETKRRDEAREAREAKRR